MPELPLTLTGCDATARLRAAGLVPDPYGKAAEVARVRTQAPDESCARLREYYARTTRAEAERCLDAEVAKFTALELLRRRYPDRTRAVAAQKESSRA